MKLEGSGGKKIQWKDTSIFSADASLSLTDKKKIPNSSFTCFQDLSESVVKMLPVTPKAHTQGRTEGASGVQPSLF